MPQRTLNRRSRSRDEDEDYTESPARDDDGYADEEPPRRGRGRSRSRDEDEDEAPRGRRSRRSRDDDEDEGEQPRSRRSSRSRDDDEDDDRGGRSRNRPPANATGKGWKSFKEKRVETSDFIKNYSLPEDQEEIIKILDEEPFSVFNEHWLDDMPKGKKKSYVCFGEDCPLCNIGEKARTYIMFNVLDLRDPDHPVVAPWKVSSMVAEVLEGYSDSDRTSPLNRSDLYFSIQKTGGGKKGRVQVNVHPVKARDLKEDWDIDPLSQSELDDLTLFTEDDVVEFSSRSTLKAIANDLD